jgi:tetratricopeptide (TPR) repeat protein
LHSDSGLVELQEIINWSDLICIPEYTTIQITSPADSTRIPAVIKSFQISPISPDEVIKQLEESSFPERKNLEHKPLSISEKIKLQTLRLLFQRKKIDNNSHSDKKPESTILLEKLQNCLSFYPEQNNLIENLKNDFADLEERNQNQLDKLMNLFHDNPEEALKYAIPLDTENTSRGGKKHLLDLSVRWSNFSLFNRHSNLHNSSDGSYLLPDNAFIQLQAQYIKTANELVKNKKYQKAAFVYLKLLKNFYMAARTLEDGEFYSEAAAIYMKYLNNKVKAAFCYEKANMLQQAIDLYIELNENEKIADLYLLLNNHAFAKKYYTKVINDYLSKDQFLKASIILKNKLSDYVGAQNVLMRGWEENKDSFNCLNNYFANIQNVDELQKEIQNVYENRTNADKKEAFLQVLKHEHKKNSKLANIVKSIAYEIIAQQLLKNPSIVSDLKAFNGNDNLLIRDIMRFKQKNKIKLQF